MVLEPHSKSAHGSNLESLRRARAQCDTSVAVGVVFVHEVIGTPTADSDWILGFGMETS